MLHPWKPGYGVHRPHSGGVDGDVGFPDLGSVGQLDDAGFAFLPFADASENMCTSERE
jgi:hypothetical protein